MKKKLIFFIIVTFLFLIVPLTSFAFESFQKYESNPIRISQTYPGWNQTDAFQPSVLFEDGIYKLWYTSSSGNRLKIGYVTSGDGINFLGNTILDFHEEGNDHDPSIVRLGFSYWLFFATSGGSTRYFKISKIISSDGLSWDKNTLKDILTPSLPWEERGISAPFVIVKDGTFFLFYSGFDGGNWKIGLATSHDGENWERCPNNPIISFGDAPFIMEKDNKFYLFGHFPDRSGIVLSSTEDPLSCETRWSPLTVILQSSEAYDTNHITSPTVVEKNDELRLYYSGLGGATG